MIEHYAVDDRPLEVVREGDAVTIRVFDLTTGTMRRDDSLRARIDAGGPGVERLDDATFARTVALLRRVLAERAPAARPQAARSPASPLPDLRDWPAIAREYALYLHDGAPRERAALLAPLLASELPLVAEALVRWSRGETTFTVLLEVDHEPPARRVDDDEGDNEGDNDEGDAGIDDEVTSSELEIFVGLAPPRDAAEGSIWIDPIELSIAVLTMPSFDDDLGPSTMAASAPSDRDRANERLLRERARASAATWIAVQPVARFQYAAFVVAAGRARPVGFDGSTRDPVVEAIGFDVTTGEPFAAASGMPCDDAAAYLAWFGKTFPSQPVYLAATIAAHALWQPPVHEWIGRAVFDDARRVAVSPNTLATDPRDTVDATDPEWAMVHAADEAPASVGLRSGVNHQLGPRGGRFARGWR